MQLAVVQKFSLLERLDPPAYNQQANMTLSLTEVGFLCFGIYTEFSDSAPPRCYVWPLSPPFCEVQTPPYILLIRLCVGEAGKNQT